MYRARRLGGALIDATACVMAIHQNHDYRHIVDVESKRGNVGGEFDGLPVLIYDNHKANRPARRLPISEQTAAVVIAQQQRFRTRYPHTPVGELKLLPTDRRNPGGCRAITGFSLAFAHRTWLDRMPVLHNGDGVEYDKGNVVLYAYGTATPNATPTPVFPSRCCAS